MSTVATSVIRGDNLVGLQPDDRMPQSWLRMVARVFAAYRLTPLEKSIVAYIDGFHLSEESYNFPTAIIGITDGQGFVDDQFIGFNDDPGATSPESSVTVNVKLMDKYDTALDADDPNQNEYYIVLCYTWVNIMPPQLPSFDVIHKNDYDDEHQLILGKLRRHSDDTLELIDDKRMWFWDLLEMFIGDTEIDGPGSQRVDSKTLPFLIAVKEDETMDIGWALDFHEEAGEEATDNPSTDKHHNYDIRLSSFSKNYTNINADAKSDDRNLYINGRPIFTAPVNNPSDPDNDDFLDVHDPGAIVKYDPDSCNPLTASDRFGAYHANLRLVDSSEKYAGYFSDASNSEYVNLELATYHPGAADSSGHWPAMKGKPHGAKLSHWHKEHETHLINYSNFDEACSYINDFRLGPQPFDVTINNKQILTYNDFTEIPPELIFFIGKFYNFEIPTERFPRDPSKPNITLEDGDMYYNLDEHAYYYWENNRWTLVGANAPVRGYMHEFVSTAGQTVFPATVGTDDFAADPDFLIVSRAGLILSEGEDYIMRKDGSNSWVQQIQTTKPCEAQERINVYTVNVGAGQLPDSTVVTTTFFSKSVKLNDVPAPAKIEIQYNEEFNMSFVDGILREYTADNGTDVILDTGTTFNQWFQIISVDETEGRLGFRQEKLQSVSDGTDTFNIADGYNPSFIIVYINGVMVSTDRYDATNGVNIDIYELAADDIIAVYSLVDEEGQGLFEFFQQEEIAVGAQGNEIFAMPNNPAFAIVSVGGILQQPGIDYITDGNTLKILHSTTPGDVVKLFSMEDNMIGGTTAGASVNTMFDFSGTSSASKRISYKSAEFTGDGSTTDFVVNGVGFEETPIHVDGIRVRPNRYSITNNGNMTVISFSDAPANGAWILVDYVK